jgi:DNA-binding NtrC family response regulator
MRILVVEDDKLIQHGIRMVFKDHSVVVVDSGEVVLENLKSLSFNLMFLDIKLKGHMTGVDVLTEARKLDPMLPVIIMSGLDDKDTIMKCLELGAVDYMVKGSVNPSAYTFAVHKASAWRLKQEEQMRLNPSKKLPNNIEFEDYFRAIVGKSPETVNLREQLTKIGKTDGPFLIIGETGTGKELVAHALWAAKNCKKRPLITVNCAELQSTTVEGELFGFEKGAFTGANSQRIGLFEAAHGGDIFLDEIGELPLEMQAKLLRVIQEKKIRRMGSNLERTLDFRVIAATNRNLREEVDAGGFRSDLFYRLDVHSVYLTPLKQRKSDILKLLKYYFLKESMTNVQIDPDVEEKILAFSWPGNVRQLIGFIKFVIPMLDAVDSKIGDREWVAWMAKQASGECLKKIELSTKDQISQLLQAGQFDIDKDYEDRRRDFVSTALELSNNNRTDAAKLLGVTRQRLVNWLSGY